MYPIKARNISVFEPDKAPSVGLTLRLLNMPFGLWNSGCSDNSMKSQAKQNFRTAMVGSEQVLLDSDKTAELVGWTATVGNQTKWFRQSTELE
ncbi:hypothetical protein F2Q70_00020957 [Brassica cretica]|uniref:Uncharacterized protein n=1 Tax=Brassica cretica TaxID=69181 RepID=A0A8S9GTN9_BRACR|nr:hypothetical protein F2Q70_00020957 [Brassica cretica]KAF2560035.1 hypothetical protein F2Q68_00014423 [Brassica cretica]